MYLIIFIFIFVLYFYLNIIYFYKINPNLEIFEINELNDSLLRFKTPLLFKLPKESNLTNYTCISYLLKNESFNNYPFSINDKIKLPLKIIHKYIEKEKKISSNNNDFIINTPDIYKIFKENDTIFKPILNCSTTTYDIIFGLSETPFKYSLNYYNYFIITEGIVDVILTPYTNIPKKERKFDYINMNGGILSPSNEIKCQTIKLKLKKDDVLFIPNFWYYSFRFIDNISSISSFSYCPIMNDIAILPYHILHYLQLQNIKLIPEIISTKK
uniref:Cupin-like domain-containing protein n=1 Tax=viral metagenome TaxID=1070528 RepID=A0A6C0H7N5_9ZZZZ